MSEPRNEEHREWTDADLCAHIAGLIAEPEISHGRTLKEIARAMAEAGYVYDATVPAEIFPSIFSHMPGDATAEETEASANDQSESDGRSVDA